MVLQTADSCASKPRWRPECMHSCLLLPVVASRQLWGWCCSSLISKDSCPLIPVVASRQLWGWCCSSDIKGQLSSISCGDLQTAVRLVLLISDIKGQLSSITCGDLQTAVRLVLLFSDIKGQLSSITCGGLQTAVRLVLLFSEMLNARGADGLSSFSTTHRNKKWKNW